MPPEPPLRRRVGTAALGLALAVASLAGGPAAAQDGAATLATGTSYPRRGEAVELRLAAADGAPLPGVPVSAHFRPNSETAHAEDLGRTGVDGSLVWVPHDAGVVTLRAGGEGGTAPVATAQVSVRFGAFPAVGLLVMVVAAVLLFGGAGLGFRLLLGPSRPVPAEAEPPST